MAKQNAVATVGANPLAMLGKQPAPQLENFQGSSPWVQFHHVMAKNNGKVTAALGAIPNGTSVYCGATEFKKLDPFQFICTPNYVQGYGRFEGANIVEYRHADGSRPPTGFREIISAFILVVTDGEVLPARCEFRTTKCSGFKRASDAMSETMLPQWVDGSKDRKKVADAAAKYDIPAWALLTHTGAITPYPAKDGKQAFEVLSTSSKLTDGLVLSTLAKLIKDDEFATQVDNCLKDQRKRIESFNAKIAK